MLRKRLGMGLAAAVMAVGMSAAVGPAGAAGLADSGQPHAPSPEGERRPAVADFEGHPIDLAADWGDATACLVWRQGGVLECFRSPQELSRRESELASTRSGQAPTATATAASSYSCSSSLRLFDYSGYGGRELDFWDRGYWQDLGDFGFDNQTSSFIVGGCYAHLADYADGGGWWYPGDTSPYAAAWSMGSSWDNRVSSIYIE